MLFEQYEEQIKLQRDLIIHARTFAEKSKEKKMKSILINLIFFTFPFRGFEICQLKHDIESNFTIVEQAILEFTVSLIILS